MISIIAHRISGWWAFNLTHFISNYALNWAQKQHKIAMIWSIIIFIVVMFVGYLVAKDRKFSVHLITAISFISLGVVAIMCYPLLTIGVMLLFVGYCCLKKAPKTEPKAAEKPAETKPIQVC